MSRCVHTNPELEVEIRHCDTNLQPTEEIYMFRAPCWLNLATGPAKAWKRALGFAKLSAYLSPCAELVFRNLEVTVTHTAASPPRQIVCKHRRSGE